MKNERVPFSGMVQALGGFLIVAAAINGYQIAMGFYSGLYSGVEWNAVFIIFFVLACFSVILPLAAGIMGIINGNKPKKEVASIILCSIYLAVILTDRVMIVALGGTFMASSILPFLVPAGFLWAAVSKNKAL